MTEREIMFLIGQVEFGVLLFFISRVMRGVAHLKNWKDFDVHGLYLGCWAAWFIRFSMMKVIY